MTGWGAAMAQRIAILGGTFDPVHVGHLVLAVCAREQLAADRLLLVPNVRSPLKSTTPQASFADRYEMLCLAVGDDSGVSISDIEGQRGGISFTIDTLRALRDEYAHGEFFLLLGGDALRDFSAWKDHQEVAALAHLVGVQRGVDPLAPAAPLKHVIEMPRIDVSSSLLRVRIAAGLTIDFMTPAAVVLYIRSHGLYRRA
ncbi:MAG: nicotinate-nucleotide adenylyltransferase [Candidatus Zixiibacteriota bacterium]